MKVVHCKKEAFDVYIGRPSKWGNPFTHISDGKTLAKFVVKDRNAAIAAYRAYLWKQLQAGEVTKEELLALDGKTLGCWCKPLACHGDVLISAVNYLKGEQ